MVLDAQARLPGALNISRTCVSCRVVSAVGSGVTLRPEAHMCQSQARPLTSSPNPGLKASPQMGQAPQQQSAEVLRVNAGTAEWAQRGSGQMPSSPRPLSESEEH